MNQLNSIGRNQKRVFSRRMKKAATTTINNIAKMVATTVALQKHQLKLDAIVLIY